MVRVSVMVGSWESGLMVFFAPLRSKSMVSAPAVALASSMAALKVHCLPFLLLVSHAPLILLSPSSPTLLTVNVVAASAGPDESARRSTPASVSVASVRSAFGTSLLALGAPLILAPLRKTTRTRISPKAHHDSYYPYYDRYFGT